MTLTAGHVAAEDRVFDVVAPFEQGFGDLHALEDEPGNRRIQPTDLERRDHIEHAVFGGDVAGCQGHPGGKALASSERRGRFL